jgi:Cys-rich protein (TIGR01571 family)
MSGYTTGLFDCFSDMAICGRFVLLGWCWVPSGANWAGSQREECRCIHCIAQPVPCWTRANIRKLRGVRESHYVKDTALYIFCCPCAVCQDAREMKALQLIVAH